MANCIIFFTFIGFSDQNISIKYDFTAILNHSKETFLLWYSQIANI